MQDCTYSRLKNCTFPFLVLAINKIVFFIEQYKIAILLNITEIREARMIKCVRYQHNKVMKNIKISFTRDSAVTMPNYLKTSYYTHAGFT